MHVTIGTLLLCLFTAGMVVMYEGWNRDHAILFFIGVVMSGTSGLALVFY